MGQKAWPAPSVQPLHVAVKHPHFHPLYGLAPQGLTKGGDFLALSRAEGR